ncbi:hypothetical protein VNI00_013373 [Paramarasmius palmivorus]|uniref:F-box domain-containing protein n=1 Tax=Paramarasmius palmivorus TaxID=297713 RepID=A0AAW0C029_9AGAR
MQLTIPLTALHRVLHTPELLERILLLLGRPSWLHLVFVSRFFRNIARRLIVKMLVIKASNIDTCRDHITNITDLQTKPPVYHAAIDLAVSQWEILHHLRAACEGSVTCSLSISTSVKSAEWCCLQQSFIVNLHRILPEVNTLTLQSVECNFQAAILASYSANLVRLVLHSALAKTEGWKALTFPCLEEVELVQDHQLLRGEESIAMLVAKYVEAPLLKSVTIIGVTEIRLIGLQEVLYAFHETLEAVKVLGRCTIDEWEESPLPVLPRVARIYLELSLAQHLLTPTANVAHYLPRLKTLVLESDWTSMETGSGDIDWEGLKFSLEAVALNIIPVPRLVCGYRSPEPIHRDIFIRTLEIRLREFTGHWDVSLHFPELEQMRCDHLPTQPYYTDLIKQKASQASARLSGSSSLTNFEAMSSD